MNFGWSQLRRGGRVTTRELQCYAVLLFVTLKLLILFLLLSDSGLYPVWGSERQREQLFQAQTQQMQQTQQQQEEDEGEEKGGGEVAFLREGNVLTVGAKKKRVFYLFLLRGHMRSGTHWVANLLNLHPQVDLKGEYNLLPLLNGIDTTLKSKVNIIHKYPGFGDLLKKGVGDAIARMLYDARYLKPVKHEAVWLGDRSPHSVLPHIFPEFPTIFILRDGRDVVVSVIFHMLRTCKVGVKEGCLLHRWYGKDPATIAEFERKQARYADKKDYFHLHPQQLITQDDGECVRGVARSWVRLFHDFEKANDATPGKVLLVRYEDLHANVTWGRDRMFRFLGADPSMAMKVSSDTRTEAGFSEADWAGFYRKGSVGEWKAFANDYFREWMKEEAGEALISAGYERNGEW